MGVDAVDLAPSLIAWLDLFGIAVFAASGALAAARRQQTLVTFSFFALVTGVGGGLTHGSTVNGEWEEALWKARFVKAAVSRD